MSTNLIIRKASEYEDLKDFVLRRLVKVVLWELTEDRNYSQSEVYKLTDGLLPALSKWWDEQHAIEAKEVARSGMERFRMWLVKKLGGYGYDD